ncbi:MAG: cation transporter [Ignavibacteria bacterium]|nr:cation transporter [Ignavibacteria bacterium]
MKTKLIFKYLNYVVLMLLFISFGLKAEGIYDNKTEVISLPTVQCGMCKKNIEKAVKKIDGVTKIIVDISDKKASVTFDDTKTSLTAIENAISNAGYQANNKLADEKAYDKLDDCCKIP